MMRERGADAATTQIGRMGAEDPSRISGRDREITTGGLDERFGAQVAEMLGAAEHRSERMR